MTLEEIKILREKGHLIAGHTRTHLNLGIELSDNILQNELNGTVDFFKKECDINTSWFAFPFGGIQFICPKSLKAINQKFRFCFSGIRGSVSRNSNRMALPRQSVTIQDPYLLQLALIFGAANLFHQSKTRKIEKMLRLN
jgi:peptidoglycan/xylan/chitin deacetylase (PgdA/CDA1 family)